MSDHYVQAWVIQMPEATAAGTWSPRDLSGGGDPAYSCRFCGLTPTFIEKARRINPVTALLEPDPPPAWVQAATRYRCRNRQACEARQQHHAK